MPDTQTKDDTTQGFQDAKLPGPGSVENGDVSQSDETSLGKEVDIKLTASWGGKKLIIYAPATTTVLDLKRKLHEVTHVDPKRQKLLGLVKGKIPPDEKRLTDCNIKEDHNFVLMGTVEAQILKEPEEVPDVVDDFEMDEIATSDPATDPENRRKLQDAIDRTSIVLINELRPGKKLLVLDLDYTIFDCKSTASSIAELARPGMHEFLTAVYQYYEIVIWSQTAWRYLEAKITELGLLSHPSYRILCTLDKTSMFTISGTRKGHDGKLKSGAWQVKPLELVWRKIGWSKKDTIHVDDLGKNFAMNPSCGLKIPAFQNAPKTRRNDKVLYGITKYLLQIASHPDFTKLDHSKWRTHEGDLPADIGEKLG